MLKTDINNVIKSKSLNKKKNNGNFKIKHKIQKIKKNNKIDSNNIFDA